MPEITIGDVARRTGVAASAIRYYEDIGLLPRPRRVGGKRRYDRSVFAHLALIQLAKEAGFKLAEVKTLVRGVASGDRSPRRLRALARKKLPEVDEALRRAQLMRRLLVAIDRCECPTLDECVTAARRAGLVVGPIAGSIDADAVVTGEQA